VNRLARGGMERDVDMLPQASFVTTNYDPGSDVF
jgi:hypothetical protein